MMIVIILLLFILLGTIIGVFIYMMGEMRQDQMVQVTPPPVVEIGIRDTVTFNTGGSVTRNLRREGTARNWVLMAEFSFEVYTDGDDEIMSVLMANVDRARHIINTVVGRFSHEELEAINGIERMSEQILTLMSEEFQTNRIISINIVDIVLSPI